MTSHNTIQPLSKDIVINESIEDPIAWDSVGNSNFYLTSGFLNTILDNPPTDIESRFIQFYKNDQLVGIAYFQIKYLQLAKSMRLDRPSESRWSPFSMIKNTILRTIKQKILVLGDLLVTGDNIFKFEESIAQLEIDAYLSDAITKVIAYEKTKGNRIGNILAKDFFINEDFKKIKFEASKFTKFTVQPCMILELDPSWSSLVDYLASMKAKHRKRAKRAFKKGASLEFKQLSTHEVVEYNETIFNLYQQTSDNAGFNLFILHKNYFKELLINNRDNINIHGVFQNGDMVAFYTTIIHSNSLDAHFLGYQKKINAESQLYLNILFKLVEKAIYDKVSFVNLSRTAMEIKSSVGAKSYEMNLYLKSTNKILNWIIHKFLHYFIPQQKWTPRNPFK